MLQIFSRYQYFGGEERCVYRIGDALETLFDVENFLASTKDLLGENPLEKIKLPFRMLHNSAISKQLVQHQKVGRFDLWQVHNVFPAMSPSVYTTARKMGIPIVQYLHNYRLSCVNGFFLNHGSPCQRCIGGNFLPALLTGCWHTSRVSSGAMGLVMTRVRMLGVFDQIARYVAISEKQKEIHIKMGIPTEKIDVIYHFYEAAGPPLPVCVDGNALFIGRLSPEKGGMVLLEAWRQLSEPSRKLYIVGEGPEEKKMQDFCVLHGLKNVYFTGFLDEAGQKEIWEKTAFVIVPSIWEEPFGLVLLEAWSKGRAIISHRIGALTELVEHGKTGILCEADQPETLAAAIQHYFQYPLEAVEAGRAGYDCVLDKFSKNKWMENIRQVYEKLGIKAATV